MAMVESPLLVPAGCWGDGGRGLLLQRRRRRQQRQLIQLEEQDADQQDEEGSAVVDHFDRLPDSVLLLVFNRVGDVKALARCCAVSRRFHALVPEVDSLLVRVDWVIPDDDDAPPSSSDAYSSGYSDKPRRGLFSHLARLVVGGIVRPLQAIGQILAILPIGGGAGKDSSAVWDYRARHPSPPAASSSSDAAATSDVSHHSPTEVLRNFKEMRRLRIELPAGEVSVDDGVLLKWKANFGSTLNNCVILGASSAVSSAAVAAAAPTTTPPSQLTEKRAAGDANINGAGRQLTEEGSCRPDGTAGGAGGDDSGTMPESFYTNGGLKQRVMWTISSLMAASSRHHMLQPIVADHGTLESLDLVDTDGQGVLRMERGQLEELRAKSVPTASGSPQRTLVPALDIRLWHAQRLELSDGMVLQGATLAAIQPSEDQTSTGKQDMSWVSGAFEEEEPYGSAVRQLLKGRMYCLEMNSF
ncbi:hypothetical protein Taro_030876 [Colocasia esculenta]|uniref:F-box domain-containing protein n=1 Tax=Colocasia esculenta TaxID=4460 RepID=A0A843W4P3_COLES|nr:hypothetical protein [Colocasia esculenta]